MPPGAKNAVDVTTDACARSCGFLTVLMAITGAILACGGFFSCEFLVLKIPTLIPPADGAIITLPPTDFNDTISLAPSASPTAAPPTEQKFGIFLYFDNDEKDCLYYDLNPSEIGTHYQVARFGVGVMTIAAILATGMLMLEFFFCRFYCARTIATAGCVFVILGAMTSFVLFFDPRCRPRDGSVNICERGQGANQTIACASFYFTIQILLCFTPKAVPIIRIMDSMDFSCMDSGWCHCCTKPLKRVRGNKDEDIDAEEQVELIKNEAGHTFKQYHDEMAGLTFQNQYTAAYKRWLVFEEDYETALTRFKGDCEEADVNWREFLKRARMRGRVDIFQDETSTAVDDEDQYLDEELLRFVDVLNTLQRNCDFAKGVMERISKDINDQAQQEDEMRRRKAEKKGGWGKRKKSPEEVEAGQEFQSITGTVGELPIARGTSTAPSLIAPSFSFGGDASITELDQDGDVFKSARAGIDRESFLFKSARMTQDGLSTGVNQSVVPSHGHSEEELSSKKRRGPFTNFVFGVTGIDWAVNRVKRRDNGSAESVVRA